MHEFINFFIKLFGNEVEKECSDVICQVQLEGKKELDEIRNKSLEDGSEQVKVIDELKTILREQRDLEVQKKQAEVKARIQQRIIEIKNSALKRKDEQKKEKIAEIRRWLETV